MWKNLKNIYLIIFLLNLYFAGSGSDSLEMDKIHSRTLPSRSLEFSRKTLYLELWAEVFGILTFIVWQTFFYILGIIFLIFSLNKIGSSQPVIISALYWMWKTSARNPILHLIAGSSGYWAVSILSTNVIFYTLLSCPPYSLHSKHLYYGNKVLSVPARPPSQGPHLICVSDNLLLICLCISRSLAVASG